MAERRVGHHLRRGRCHPVRAASRPSLRGSHGFHGGHRHRRRCSRRSSHLRCCRTWRALRPSASHWPCPGARRCRDGATVADGRCLRPWRANFVPLLAPANQMSYDTVQFYNAALAIVAGLGAAALSFRLMPPLSPAFRTRRLLALTLRDLRRLASGSDPADARRLGGPHVRPALGIAGRGRAVAARAASGGPVGGDRNHPASPHRYAARIWDPSSTRRSTPWREATARSRPHASPGSTTRLSARPGVAALRARGSILAMSEALTQHAAYFDAGAPG